MIQTPKYEFSRKPKKMPSREKQLAFGLNHPAKRIKTKESEERKISIDNCGNNSKPHQLILNLRSELIDLKHQVTKLSKKDVDIPSQGIEQKIENRVKSPVPQKKIILNKSKDIKQTLSSDRAMKRLNSKDGLIVGKNKNSKSLNSLAQLREVVAELQIRNRQLQHENDQLTLKLKNISEGTKRQNQTKQKQRPSHKELLQTDRTINYQKQLRESKLQIDQLNEIINKLTITNCKLIDQMTKLKQELSTTIKKKEKQINQKDQHIQILKQSTNQMKITIDSIEEKMRKKIEDFQVENNEIRLHLEEQRTINKELKEKAEISLKINLSLKKLNFQLAEKMQKNEEKNLKNQNQNNSPQSIKELTEIIVIQQKSLQNQLSDISYLQNEIQKLKIFKQVSHNQAKLLEQLTAEVIQMNIVALNKKYIHC